MRCHAWHAGSVGLLSIIKDGCLSLTQSGSLQTIESKIACGREYPRPLTYG